MCEKIRANAISFLSDTLSSLNEDLIYVVDDNDQEKLIEFTAEQEDMLLDNLKDVIRNFVKENEVKEVENES